MIVEAITDAIERLGVRVRFEELSTEDVQGRGGRCRLGEKEMIIIDRGLGAREKIHILAKELARLPHDDIYLPPNVREAVEKVAGEND